MEKHTTSTSRIIICLATILLLGAPTAHGERLKAKIEFTPSTVVPLVTLRLNLKCTLVPDDSSDDGGVIDVQSVLGVNIKQNNTDGEFETVASVSTSNPDDPTLYGNWEDKNISIDANLNKHSRLLEVTVPDPTVEFTGELQCKIFVNDGEAVKTLSDQDTIGYQDPDTKIFLSEMRRLKLESEAQQQTISAQMEELREAKNEIKDLETNVSTQVSFSAVRDNGQISFFEFVSRGTDLVLNKALVNIGEGYDTSTGVFTCPVAGSYYIRYDLQVLAGNGGTQSGVELLLNGRPVTWSYMWDGDTDSSASGVIGNGIVLQLNQGDELKVRTDRDSYLYWRYGGGYASTFSGYLLK